MASYLGARVVRGPDWEGGDQDGGEGFVGTIVELEEGNSTAKVQWDAGLRQSYLCGLEGKYELRILDCAPAGTDPPVEHLILIELHRSNVQAPFNILSHP